MLEGLECNARLRRSDAVDFTVRDRGGVGRIGKFSMESHAGTCPGEWTIDGGCAGSGIDRIDAREVGVPFDKAAGGMLGMLGNGFLLYLDVGTVDFLMDDMDDRADTGTAGNRISSSFGAAFPGMVYTCSTSVLVVSSVLGSLLIVMVSSELPGMSFS